MRTSQLDQIVRQRSNPELLGAVQQLATGHVETGIKMLADQGRITEIQNPRDRIAAIAKDYAASPERTLVVSPDNRSRQQINDSVRAELLTKGRPCGGWPVVQDPCPPERYDWSRPHVGCTV